MNFLEELGFIIDDFFAEADAFVERQKEREKALEELRGRKMNEKITVLCVEEVE